MGPVEKALREKYPPTLFGGEDINSDSRKILGHCINHVGLGIADPRLSEESSYNTSKAASGELVESLLGGTAFNYIGHRACVCQASLAARRERKHVEMAEMARQNYLAGGQERNRLHRETRNGAWLSAVPTALTAQSCLGRNSRIISASDMG